MKEQIIACAASIARAKRVVVFSGAGMSAESGIGTFRGQGGFWKGVMGPIILGYFGTPVGWNWTPAWAWSKYVSAFYQPMADAKPNAGHLALAELAKVVPTTIITQNVDGLHQRAGNDPDRVFELHGTVRRYRCHKASHPYTFESPAAGEALVLPATCPMCQVEGCGSYIRPDCVLFTESLPPRDWNEAERAMRSLREGDVVLIVGTSATVQPAASLPGIAEGRATFYEFNLEETGFSQLEKHHLFKGPAGEILPTIVEQVRELKQGGSNL